MFLTYQSDPFLLFWHRSLSVGPQFSLKGRNKMALYRTPVFAASQPASCYAERSARYPAGTPGLEQDGLFQGSSFRRPVTKVYVVVAVNIDIPHYILFIVNPLRMAGWEKILQPGQQGFLKLAESLSKLFCSKSWCNKGIS
jgi:hypothetical protein